MTRTWIFDLDNTLYCHKCGFDRLALTRLNQYIANLLDIDEEEAQIVRRQYYKDHGTSLSGLVINHDIDVEAYGTFVYDLDYSQLPKNPALVEALETLPGRKLIYTNALHHHAHQAVRQLGIEHLLDAVVDLTAMDFVGKPNPAAFRRLLQNHKITPETAIFCDDLARNIATAVDLGLTGVHICDSPDPNSKAHHSPSCLVTWLQTEAQGL